jgi:thioesterase domain-containing protein
VLQRLFARVLDRADVGVDDSFFDLGGQSLLAVRLTALIGRELAMPVPVGSLIAYPTVTALAVALDSQASSEVVRLRDGDRVTIAFIHPVGGTLFCYAALVSHLPDGVGAVGCERLPGQHPPETSVADMADRYAKALHSEVPDGPLVLAGWSVGGVLAHAVAARLVAAGRPVAHLVLLDSLAMSRAEDRAAMRRSAAQLAGLTRETPGYAGLLAAYGVDVTQVHGDDAPMFADWADLLALVADHEPTALAVPATLLLATGNPGDLPARITASWAGLTKDLRVRPVAAHHLTILAPPALPAVAFEIGEVAGP